MTDKLSAEELREIKDRCQLRREHIETSYTDDRTVDAQLHLHHVIDRESLLAHVAAQGALVSQLEDECEKLRDDFDAQDEEIGRLQGRLALIQEGQEDDA